MVGLFRRGLSQTEKDALLAFIRHGQFLFASQQLTMELFNDALERASDTFAEGDEILVRSYCGVSSPDLAAQLILPALQEKIQLLESVVAMHETLHAGTDKSSRTFESSRLLAAATRICTARGKLQLECWTEWVNDPSLDLTSKMSMLDNSEMQAMGTAVNSLNKLIRIAGIGQKEFLEINRQAFNLVRARRRLPPLQEEEFERLYSAGLAGRRVRFFSYDAAGLG